MNNEENKVKIHLDIGVIDTTTVTRGEKPQDFWGRKFWFDRYASRSDLEIQIYKDKIKILKYMLPKESVNIMLPIRRGQPREFEGATYMPTGTTFSLHTKNEDAYHIVEPLLNKVYYGNYSWETDDHMIWKGKMLSENTDITEPELHGIIDGVDYLSFHPNIMDSFGGFEKILNREMISLLQKPGQEYVLEIIHINAYMQRMAEECDAAEVPTKLLPVDIREYSAYTDVVDTLIRTADEAGFSGFRCEWVIAGRDRNSVVLLIEDGDNRWDGAQYQIAFEISLYQLPGLFHGTPENVIRSKTNDCEHFALDSIIASGDKCDSVETFTDWAEGYYFGHRVD